MFKYSNSTGYVTNDQLVARSMRSIFLWQSFGIGLCASVGLLLSNTSLWRIVTSNQYIVLLAMLGSFFASLYVSRAVARESSSYTNMIVAFFAYWILDGVFLSVVFRWFTATSIVLSFGIALALFVTMALYGYLTNTNLDSFGSLLSVSLIGIMIVSLVNMFYQSSLVHYMLSYVGIMTFTGLVAFYIQKIKVILQAAHYEANDILAKKMVIFGALYLGMVLMQIALYILQFLGNSRD